MDMYGVVKFPTSKMEKVLARAKRLLEEEKEQAATFRDSEFSLEKWKARLGVTKLFRVSNFYADLHANLMKL